MKDGKPKRLAKDKSRPHQICEMPEFDVHEHGMWISGDGTNSSVPWKIAKYGVAGALGDEQIRSIVAEFALGIDDLRRLSLSLGVSLHPIHNLIPVTRSTATARAVKEVKSAHKKINSAMAAVNSAITGLERVQPESGDPGSADRLQRATVLHLKAIFGQLSAALSAVDKLSKNPQALLLIAPNDKRRLHDQRRELVLSALFHFWANAGRKLTFTTDPLTSKRRGPLIDFVNAVVACVTDPPSTLKGESIVTELRKFDLRD